MAYITVEVSLDQFDDEELLEECQNRSLSFLSDCLDEELIEEVCDRGLLPIDPNELTTILEAIQFDLSNEQHDFALDKVRKLCKDVLGTAL